MQQWGMGDGTETDEFQEMLPTAFDPPFFSEK